MHTAFITARSTSLSTFVRNIGQNFSNNACSDMFWKVFEVKHMPTFRSSKAIVEELIKPLTRRDLKAAYFKSTAHERGFGRRHHWAVASATGRCIALPLRNRKPLTLRTSLALDCVGGRSTDGVGPFALPIIGPGPDVAGAPSPAMPKRPGSEASASGGGN